MKTALITGGLRGIGLGISKSLLTEGYSLALCGSREIDQVSLELHELRSQCSENQKAVYYRCDIGNRNDRQELVQKIRCDFHQLNLLVNNAGVTAKNRNDILTMTEENYDWLMKINVQGPFFLTQAIVQWMIDQKETNPEFFASVINISSISATAASLNRGEYCMSKAALSMTTQLWSLRLAEYGISVYEIRPGLIQSDMTASVTEKYSKLIDDGVVPQRRWGFPEDVGRAVAMLARGDLAYSAGQVIMIDGGMMIPKL
ncbi:MAG: 3-ketoacyl-ACP reductase [Planctomycetaceae bacterium]|jgi:NAD(P)-dependent dehydrogenase (short-subunit alcohol dehydrogenase family)|nr:3-ketoacyl-ACP reductase [Planctomycetaceae bacterium]